MYLLTGIDREESGGDSKKLKLNNYGDYITSKNMSDNQSIALAIFDTPQHQQMLMAANGAPSFIDENGV